MPATQHDLWVWIAGHTYDKVFDASREACAGSPRHPPYRRA